MHTEFRQVMADLEHRDDVRAVVVTGTPPAFCVGGDSAALTGHADRGGYDSGLPAGRPTRRWRPARRRLRLAARLPAADHRRGQRRLRGGRPRTRRVLRSPLRRRRREDHDRRTEARAAGGVRAELDPASPDRRDASERPAPVGSSRHRRRDRRLGTVERCRRRRRIGAGGRSVVRPSTSSRPPARTPFRSPSARSPPICCATTRRVRSPTRSDSSMNRWAPTEYREGVRALTEKRPRTSERPI